MEIFKLIGSIMVDSTEANKSISKTEKNAEGMGKKLADGVKTAGKWAAGLTAAAVSVGAADREAGDSRNADGLEAEGHSAFQDRSRRFSLERQSSVRQLSGVAEGDSRSVGTQLCDCIHPGTGGAVDRLPENGS